MTREKKYRVIVDMSLSNQDIESLKKRLNINRNLSPRSKTNLNVFINNKKNAFDRSTFMQQYNAKMRNLRSRDASIGKRKRSPGNLNSAMQNNTGSVSSGSVNPNKRSRMSPRGPLSGVSGASNTSNNENVSSRSMNNGYDGFSNSNNENNLERNAKRRKNNSQTQPQPQFVTAARASSNSALTKENLATARWVGQQLAGGNRGARNAKREPQLVTAAVGF